MKTVAVIAEYNPFHKGHARQLAAVRRDFGEDSAVVAIMSGNFVQRGTPAVIGKFDRAKMAVDAGVSLVLELPFPYSMASAEYFAEAGVSIANDLGAVDALSFGSEAGDISLLSLTAHRMKDPDFKHALSLRLQSKEEKAKGYARVLSETFTEHFGEDVPVKLDLPNNILAISYISALQKFASPILPHTIPRKGTDACGASPSVLAGATYVRDLLLSGKTEEALSHMPDETHAHACALIESGVAPVSPEALAPILLSHLRMEATGAPTPAECGGGVLRLLEKAAREAVSLSHLTSLAATKKYTDARLRRAALFSYFGVTPAHLKQKPLYSQVLAMDAKGQAILADIRKKTSIPLLTKPADLYKLSREAREQAERTYRADSVYALLFPTPQRADIFLRTAPYRK